MCGGGLLVLGPHTEGDDEDDNGHNGKHYQTHLLVLPPHLCLKLGGLALEPFGLREREYYCLKGSGEAVYSTAP